MNALETPASILATISRLAARIDAPNRLMPGMTPSGLGAPHIEVDDHYHLVVCERGVELERRTTLSLDELLYWAFAAVTFSMAADWEVAHREAHQDSRRQLFNRQRELLNAISSDWAVRYDVKTAELLRAYPFQDR